MSEVERHLHRCQNCGMIWGHGNMLIEDVEAHKCPKCGKSEWGKYSGRLSDAPHPPRGNTLTVVTWDYRAYLQALLTVAVVVMGAILLGELLAPWLLRRKA